MFFLVYIMNHESKIQELNERYGIILNEFTHMYPQSQTYPNNAEYTKNFAIDSGNLHKLQGDFFKFRDNLENDIDNLSKSIRRTDIQIALLEKKNTPLLKKLTSLENDNDASEGMLDDIELLYNQYLLGNWILLVGLGGSIFLYYKTRS